jgi:hypothetical protein
MPIIHESLSRPHLEQISDEGTFCEEAFRSDELIRLLNLHRHSTLLQQYNYTDDNIKTSVLLPDRLLREKLEEVLPLLTTETNAKKLVESFFSRYENLRKLLTSEILNPDDLSDTHNVFNKFHDGSLAPVSGIYCCKSCSQEILIAAGNKLELTSHVNNNQCLCKEWGLIVYFDEDKIYYLDDKYNYSSLNPRFNEKNDLYNLYTGIYKRTGKDRNFCIRLKLTTGNLSLLQTLKKMKG